MSYNQKINFGKYDWKSYPLRHINIVIAHKNLILLKQDFSHVAFFQPRVKSEPAESECLCSQGWYLLKVFGLLRNPCRAVLDYVSSAYRIAFAVESKRGWKQREFAPKNAIHFVSKLIIFQRVESDTGENLERPRSDVYQQRWSRGHKARGQGQGHKKIRGQGQGQPFRGQTLSRPRTGMLEAIAKDQGHKCKCSPKKKGLYKKFLSDLHK